jgi:hypothetical protein
MLELRDGVYDKWQAGQLFTRSYTNQTKSWLVHGWNIFGASTSHEHTQIHKAHHGLVLREITTFPTIAFSMISHGGCIQMSFCPMTLKLGVSKFPKLGLLILWKAITSYIDLRLKWVLKHVCSVHQELSKGMWHATYKHVF